MMAMRYKGTVGKEPVVGEMFYDSNPFFSLNEYLQNGKYFAEWILETHGRTIKGEVKIYNGERLKVNLQRIK